MAAIDICSFLRRNRILVSLILFAISFYFFILYQLGGFDFIYNSIYSTGDSLEYSDYSKWIKGEIEYCNSIRTFFYPLLILIASVLPGNSGIWLLQFLLWLCACILIYCTVLKITAKVTVAAISFLLSVFNISLIVYTAHALTEITAFFLLSLISFILSVSAGRPQKLVFVLILSVLVSVKPLFFIVFCFFLITFIAFKYNEFIGKPVMFLLLFLSSSPVLIQAGINKIKHGTCSITQVADINIKQYFYRKTKYYFENSSSPDLKSGFNKMPDSTVFVLKRQASVIDMDKIIIFLLKHPKQSLMVYWDNIMENFGEGNPYIYNNRRLKKLSSNINTNFISIIHLIMSIFWIYFLIKKTAQIRTAEYQFILWNGVLTFYILFSSGITFWAGDRLVVSATSLCCILYMSAIYLFFKKPQINNQTCSRK